MQYKPAASLRQSRHKSMVTAGAASFNTGHPAFVCDHLLWPGWASAAFRGVGRRGPQNAICAF